MGADARGALPAPTKRACVAALSSSPSSPPLQDLMSSSAGQHMPTTCTQGQAHLRSSVKLVALSPPLHYYSCVLVGRICRLPAVSVAVEACKKRSGVQACSMSTRVERSTLCRRWRPPASHVCSLHRAASTLHRPHLQAWPRAPRPTRDCTPCKRCAGAAFPGARAGGTRPTPPNGSPDTHPSSLH